MARVLKRIKGRWYVYEVITKYLGPVDEVGTKEEKKKIALNPAFFKQGKFLYPKELESMVKDLLNTEDVKLKGIYIYGSQIKGIYGGESDLDVWVKVKPMKKGGERLYSGPTLLTTTRRMDNPPKNVPRVKLKGIEIEVCRSTFDPKPPYFDVHKQRLIE